MKRPSPKSIRELMAQLEADQYASRERDAVGWVVVSVDDEHDGELVCATGLFPDGPSALAEVVRAEQEDERWQNTGWRYAVVPVFAPGERNNGTG